MPARLAFAADAVQCWKKVEEVEAMRMIVDVST